MKEVVSEIDCIRVSGDEREKTHETIAKEAVMRLFVNDKLVTEFLFSPGFEEQLVVGYLLSSGLIKSLNDVENIALQGDTCKTLVSVREDRISKLQDIGITVSHQQLINVRSTLLVNQRYHIATRGFHGAILWELSSGRWFVCEDIGRHNAIDKVIGYGLKEKYMFSHSMVLLSGRLTSNIVSKCRNSGIPLMASMTVATDGGIKQASDSNITIIGSLSEEGFWLYNEGVVKVT